MTSEHTRRINEAIMECDRFITREESRNPSLRPADIQDMLDRYKKHRLRLVNWLATGIDPMA